MIARQKDRETGKNYGKMMVRQNDGIKGLETELRRVIERCEGNSVVVQIDPVEVVKAGVR